MSSPCDIKGVAMQKIPYKKSAAIKKGDKIIKFTNADANIQTSELLNYDHLHTFKDELRTIIESWRNIYGPFPWCGLAEQYGDGDVKAVSAISKARREVDLRVKI